jgi:hypothetical protein
MIDHRRTGGIMGLPALPQIGARREQPLPTAKAGAENKGG